MLRLLIFKLANFRISLQDATEMVAPLKMSSSSSSSDRVDSRGTLRQPRVAWRRALDHSARMLKGVPSPICWIHEWRRRPGRRRQPGPKREPVLAAATCDNARWAGVWSSSLTTWPNNEFRLLAMISWTQGRLDRPTTSVLTVTPPIPFAPKPLVGKIKLSNRLTQPTRV